MHENLSEWGIRKKLAPVKCEKRSVDKVRRCKFCGAGVADGLDEKIGWMKLAVVCGGGRQNRGDSLFALKFWAAVRLCAT